MLYALADLQIHYNFADQTVQSHRQARHQTALDEYKAKHAGEKFAINRNKGLGEQDAEELYEGRTETSAVWCRTVHSLRNGYGESRWDFFVRICF